MLKIKTLIIDDEAPARARMKRLLQTLPEIEVIGEASDGLDALEKIGALKPDLVFLDIEMPELTGIDVARSLGVHGPAIVFVTAYDEHALRAFEVAAIDYVVKPVAVDRLHAAVAKVKKSLSPAMPPQLPELPVRKLAIRSGSKYVVFDPSKVSAVLARDHYAAVLIDGRELLSDDSLDSLSRKFPVAGFLRVHRSALINLEYLRELDHEGDRKYAAVLSDSLKTRVPVSRERLGELKERLGIP